MNESQRNLALGLIVGGLAGLGGGFFGASQLDSQATHISSPNVISPGMARPTLGSKSNDVALAPLERGAQGEGRSAPIEASAKASYLPTSKVRDLITKADPQAVDREVGNDAIWGVVRDDRDAPLAGVVIRAVSTSPYKSTTSPSSVGEGPPEIDSLEDTVRKAVDGFHKNRASRFEAVSSADGTYRIEQLPESFWRLEAHLANYSVAATRALYRIRGNSAVDFKAKAVIEIPVQVVALDGLAVPSAVIEVTTTDRRAEKKLYTWDTSTPNLRLSAGRYLMAAHDGIIEGSGYGQEVLSRRKSEKQTVVIKTGEAPALINFKLEGQGAIKGRVIFSNDIVHSGHGQVYLAVAPAGGDVDLAALVKNGQSATYQGDGEFRFTDLENGIYVIGVSRGWREPVVAHESVKITGTLQSIELVMPAINRNEFLAVQATGSDGESLTDLSISFRHKNKGGSSSNGVNPLVTPAEEYLVTIPDEARVDYEAGTEGHTFELELSHTVYGSKKIELSPGQRELVVNFSVPAEVEVTISGFAGSGYEGRLSITIEGTSRRRSRSFSGDAPTISPAGIYKNDGMDPGSYTVVMRVASEKAGNRWDQGTAIAKQMVELSSGINHVQMSIPTLYSLNINAPSLDSGTRVTLSPIQEDGKSTDWSSSSRMELDSTSQVRFTDLPTGKYSLRAGRMQREIQVPCGDVILDEE
ncbi:MAG: hypothetical protein ACI841_001401 [Planctomycetota bacterium]|jgi:hypothetical protein